MWNNFCAVIEDLFWFALGRGAVSQSNPQPIMSTPYQLPPRPLLTPVLTTPKQTAVVMPTQVLLEAQSHSTAQAVKPVAPLQSVARPEFTHDQTANILHAPVVMYVSAPQGTACIFAPQLDFDAVIDTLTYGTAVTVIGYQGRYASVNRSNITGWVVKDDLTPQKYEVWPEFISGTVYDAQHTETKKTRLLINDTFGAGLLSLPLQAGEYITLRLQSEHRAIAWSKKRPRKAGSWATLLRGNKGVYIGVTPKTDSIMEYQSDDGEGRLGYVEAVTPELAITISMVGEGESGRYTVKTMSAEVWRELRPVFIEVA
ncbi:MAG: hypothetical protein V4606_00885 [Patescibacteria group bacterium]